MRAYYQIKVDLNTVSNDLVKSEFCVLFSIACDNFEKEHQRKVIDWDKRKSIIHGSFPGWRKNNQAPPSIVHNKYAEKISKAILGNKIDLSGNDSHQSLRSFLDRRTKRRTSPNSQSHCPTPQPPPPPPLVQHDISRNKQTNKSKQHHRPGVTDYDRLFPKRNKYERKKNRRVMENRGLNNHNNPPENAEEPMSD